MGTGASTAVVAAESTPVEPSPLAHQDTAELSALLKELPEGSRKRLTEALDAVETAAADPAKSAADKKSLLDELIAALKEVPQAMQARLKTALDTVVSDPARAAVAAAASAADHLTAAMVALKDLPQDMRTRLTNAVFTSVAPAPVSAAPSGPPPYYPVAPEDGELNEINLIVDGLYLSNWRGAEDEAQLAELGITHIAAVGTEFTEDEEHGRTFWKKDISDDESAGEEMSKALRDVAAFQHKALKGGGKCLVHCAAGISRSATCVLAYMVIHRKQRLFDALGVVIGARRPIWPNDGFMKALIALEAESSKLAEEDRMSKRLMRKDTWEREGEAASEEASVKSVKEETAEKKAATVEKAQDAPGKGAPSDSADAKPKATDAKATDSKAA